jgi:O-antigen/teichoic acid export membrane protein
MLANSLDSVLISGLKGLDSAAVFILSSYIVTLISIPHRTISNISTPVLAESWKHGDVKNIETIYKKSSITLFASTYFMFILIWLNLDNGYAFLQLPEIYQNGKYIVLLLGLAKVIDMGFGLNHEIMISSKYWKQNFYIQVVLIIVFIPVNYFSILRYGIVGPAISNLVLMLFYNLFRSYFIWNKFRLSPFTINILYCLLAGAVLYFLADRIPAVSDYYLLNMVVRSVFFSVLYILFLFKFEISPDINGVIDNVLSKLNIKQK